METMTDLLVQFLSLFALLVIGGQSARLAG